MAKSDVYDPLRIGERLYQQVAVLLDQLEARDDPDSGAKITLKERIAALIAVGRLQTIFAALRRKEPDDPDAGSAVRKYAGAFKDETGRGKKGSRRPPASQPEPRPDNWFDRDTTDDGDTEFDA
jgi:hypothetical protein